MIKVSDYVAHFLRAQGVPVCTELIGGMIAHLVDSLYKAGAPKLVSMHHEQGAAFAAEGFARMTGIPGVAMATSGPGATNLLTGVGSCYFDSVPAVFITGQVNRNEQKGARPIRQLGFQETDIVSMAAPITKRAWRVTQPDSVPAILRDAFALALSGRPGPVLIDLPMDVQRTEIDAPPPQKIAIEPSAVVSEKMLQPLLAALKRAQRPLVLVGGGMRAALAGTEFCAAVEALGVPVVCSLLAVDALPYAHPLRVGMIGSYGNRWANQAIGAADLLLVVGSRLDVRQTGALTDAFKGDREVFHVDIDAGEINNRVTGCTPIIAHLRPFLKALQECTVGVSPATSTAGGRDARGTKYSAWLKEITLLRAARPDTAEIDAQVLLNPNKLLHELSRCSAQASAYVTDVGQHQMWAAQSLELTAEQRFLTSGGMGAMGFGLPAAIGAALATPGKPVVLIAGDGGFQLNIQELQTVVRNRLPLKIVLFNNNCHGMVRQFQQSYFNEQYPSTYWGYSAPDFVKVAEAFGIPSLRLDDHKQTAAAFEFLWNDLAAPALLEIKIEPFVNTYPKLAFGKPITEMEPFATPLDQEGT